MFAERSVAPLFSHCKYPRFQFSPIGHYVSAKAVNDNVNIHKLLCHKETDFLEKGFDPVGIIADFEILFNFRLVLFVVLKLKFLLNPPKGLA